MVHTPTDELPPERPTPIECEHGVPRVRQCPACDPPLDLHEDIRGRIERGRFAAWHRRFRQRSEAGETDQPRPLRRAQPVDPNPPVYHAAPPEAAEELPEDRAPWPAEARPEPAKPRRSNPAASQGRSDEDEDLASAIF